MIGKRNFIFSEAKQEAISEINLIPLIDVMLVLLITFMVAAPVSLKLIKVNIPISSVGEDLNKKQPRVVLNIDKMGKLYLDKIEVNEKNLVDSLKSIYKFQNKKELFIYADKSITYGKVVSVMNAGKKAGVHRIAMLTKPLLTTKKN